MASSKRNTPHDDGDHNDPSISPPPAKRKTIVQSSITKTAVTQFFAPASQKAKIEPKFKIEWKESSLDGNVPATLLYAHCRPNDAQEPTYNESKIAAFDLDGTLIMTKSGKTFSDDSSDWKWWHPSTPAKLRDLWENQHYRIVIFSNQGGITLQNGPKTKGPKNPKRLASWKQKLAAVVTSLDIPVSVYAATGHDVFRKPRTGMWSTMLEHWGLSETDVKKEESFFVGDAGGRTAQPGHKSAVKKDFSCSDRNFAYNIGIDYHTPEEYFLGEAPREYRRDFSPSEYPFSEDKVFKFGRKATPRETELVVFCGPPGAGKSEFYAKFMKTGSPRWERINQDQLKTREKCIKAAKTELARGRSVVIDATNPSRDVRKVWIDLAETLTSSGTCHRVIPRCVWFRTPVAVAEHNNAVRAAIESLNPEKRELVPKMAYNTFNSKFQAPTGDEGFEDILEIDFKFRGSEEEHALWSKYYS